MLDTRVLRVLDLVPIIYDKAFEDTGQGSDVLFALLVSVKVPLGLSPAGSVYSKRGHTGTARQNDQKPFK
jgi:hypothetical protein